MIDLAIIGAGRWGKNLVRNLCDLEGANLLYICDLKPEVRKRMRRLHPGVQVVERYAEVLADERVRGVVVATEEPAHLAVARDALLASKHTYVEKPITLSSADAAELRDLARERGLKLMVGHLLKYHPAVDYIKGVVDAGELGELLYVYLQRVNLGVVRQTENAWWSLGPHDVSLACHLLGDVPVSVSATGQAYLQPGIEDVVFANLKFADGRMAQIHVSWLDPHKIRKVTLVGSQKMLVFDDMEAQEKVRIYDKGADVERSTVSYVESITLRTGDIYIPRVPTAEPLRRECQHFVDCIAHDRVPLSDGEEGLRVVKVLEAGNASIAAGGAPVEVPR